MNKNIKASIAIAAGVVLLMGGAGSLAYWNDSANVGPASGSNVITAGNLTVVAQNAGTWTKGFYNQSGTQVVAPAALASLSAVQVVPGNRLVYTQTFNLTASGQDLWFKIDSTNGGVAGASAAAADTALAAAINGSTSSTISVGSVTGGNVVATGVTANTYKLNASAGPSTITVTWTIDFPFGAATSNTTKLGAVNLSQGAITLTQVAAQ
ncbi:MAG: alternate-type signal peptide domain-containing protein [Leifsonia xyli]|nr:MAG: alternate-type signal peptide domain-containing protein [Leifsonia xyli]